MTAKHFDENRNFLKDAVRMKVDFSQTAQARGLPEPPKQKPCRRDATHIDLVSPAELNDIGSIPLVKSIRQRESRRTYSEEPITIPELSFLLWSTQGTRDRSMLRTVPSAGARHPFETYLYVRAVTSLEEGIYRYLPLSHQLIHVRSAKNMAGQIAAGCLGQKFVAKAAVVFAWTVIPERTEWRYAGAAHKAIALDAGHVCQNLYLACEAIDAGTCAIAAYAQDRMDAFLGVDGKEEFTIYLAPVGKKPVEPTGPKR